MTTPWTTVGRKLLPDGSMLRLQTCEQTDLTGTDLTTLRRVQRLTLGVFWRTLPEEQAVREALIWNWSCRPAANDMLTCYAHGSAMLLRRHERLLPLTDPQAERMIVELYTRVSDDGATWYNEGSCKWLPIKDFFQA